MQKREFKQAVEIAGSTESLAAEETSLFNGFGLRDFQPVHCTIRQVAWLIRYQAMQMNGAWDAVALNDVAVFGKKKFIIIG